MESVFIRENVGRFHLQPLDGIKATQTNSLDGILVAINETISGFSGRCQTSSNSRLNDPRRQVFAYVAYLEFEGVSLASVSDLILIPCSHRKR